MPAIVGNEPGEVVFSCPAGPKCTICKHLAVALFARKHGVYAVKPVEAPAKSAHDLLMECRKQCGERAGP